MAEVEVGRPANKYITPILVFIIAKEVMTIFGVGGEISQNLVNLSSRLGGAGLGGETSSQVEVQHAPGVVLAEEVNRGDAEVVVWVVVCIELTKGLLSVPKSY